MVSARVAASIAIIIAISAGVVAIWYMSTLEVPEPMTKDVSFVHSLRDDATHYSVKEKTFIRYSRDIVLFELIPESKIFTFRSTLTYGGTDFLYFKIEYYNELSADEYVTLDVEYVTLRVDVTEGGSAIWRETVTK